MKPYKQHLIDLVVNQIAEDLKTGNVVAISELLSNIKENDLENYLPIKES